MEQIPATRAQLLPGFLVDGAVVAPPDRAQPGPGIPADQVLRGDRTRVDPFYDLLLRGHGTRLGRSLIRDGCGATPAPRCPEPMELPARVA